VRSPVEAFRKPPKAAPTIAYFMSSFMLDMEAMGRSTRVFIPPERMQEILRQSFGAKGPDIAGLFVEKTKRLENELRKSGEGVQEFLDDVDERGDDQTEYLVTLRAQDDMGENQRMWVHAVTYHVARMVEQMQKEAPEIYEVDVERMKIALVHMLADRGPVLTQSAWDTLKAENDPKVIRWLLALLGMPLREIHLSEVKRAFLENEVVRRYAMATAEDESKMREVEEMLKKEK
jgi:hypothetical protein